MGLEHQRAQHPQQDSHCAGNHLRPLETLAQNSQGFQFCKMTPEVFYVVDHLLLKIQG